MSLSRKRKKQLRTLQKQANGLWESQQALLGDAAAVAREAGRQLGNYQREQVVPGMKSAYGTYAAPYLAKGVASSKSFLADKVVPATGVVVGSAMSAWDAANETRAKLAAGRGLEAPDAKTYAKLADKYGTDVAAKLSKKLALVPEKKSGIGVGGVFAIVLGALAAAGILYAAWQTLRADDELWVADDPLRAPDA
ncbi:hypothetical protein GCM10009808_21540 [Microbacterium sediminicola]|uniref:DNA helicase n=1 Tax=Microbacterium sediminicola TaxID=415210 RepID=A0ABN2IE21_9MICO